MLHDVFSVTKTHYVQPHRFVILTGIIFWFILLFRAMNSVIVEASIPTKTLRTWKD